MSIDESEKPIYTELLSRIINSQAAIKVLSSLAIENELLTSEELDSLILEKEIVIKQEVMEVINKIKEN